MFRLKAILIAAPVAAGLLMAAPIAHGRGGSGSGRGGGSVPAGTMPPIYGAAWSAKQLKLRNTDAPHSDSTESNTGPTAAATAKGK
jgi:hypothetical protein